MGERDELMEARSSSRRQVRTWLAVSAPIALLVIVIAVGAFGPAPPGPSGLALTSLVPQATPPPTSSPAPTPGPAVICPLDPVPYSVGDNVALTGRWAGDDDGVYYLRQVGSVLWWNGMSGRNHAADQLGLDWNNVGRGEIDMDEMTIEAEWMDTPRGFILGGGTVTLQIGADSAGNLEITKLSETGSGRGDTVWVPCRDPMRP